MRAPIYLVCAALLVVVRSEPNENYMGLESVNVAADPETINYLLPKLAAKYRLNSDWRGVSDPKFYVLTEMESNDIENQGPNIDERNEDDLGLRTKRQSRIGDAGGSLSIVNSLDVLRNRLLLEIARKKAKQGANRNRQLLMNFGKRAFIQRVSRAFLHHHI